MPNFFRHAHGFTLLEVLVSLAILMVGLLGIAGLMTKGQKASYEAYQRQQALALAMDIAEKIRANQGGAPYYSNAASVATPAGEGAQLADGVDCISASCDTGNIAKNDLAQWDNLLMGATERSGASKIGGIVKARGCVEWIGGLNQPVFQVSVAWQGDSDTAAPPATASACGAGLYGTEARRRLVTLNVATCRLNGAMPWGCAS